MIMWYYVWYYDYYYLRTYNILTRQLSRIELEKREKFLFEICHMTEASSRQPGIVSCIGGGRENVAAGEDSIAMGRNVIAENDRSF